MNWLKQRQNKDNFWNLMFWFGMTFAFLTASSFASESFREYLYIGSILFWLIIILVPTLLIKFNKVTYTEDKTFLNSQGNSLNDRLPKQLFWVIILSIAATVFLGSVLDNNFKGINELLSSILIFGVFFSVPTLYFIIKNCPISILLNKNSWHESVMGIRPGTHNGHNFSGSKNSYSSLPPNYTTDARYSSMSCNIHNTNHYRR